MIDYVGEMMAKSCSYLKTEMYYKFQHTFLFINSNTVKIISFIQESIISGLEMFCQ